MNKAKQRLTKQRKTIEHVYCWVRCEYFRPMREHVSTLIQTHILNLYIYIYTYMVRFPLSFIRFPLSVYPLNGPLIRSTTPPVHRHQATSDRWSNTTGNKRHETKRGPRTLVNVGARSNFTGSELALIRENIVWQFCRLNMGSSC